jgi:hypothetical protein
MNRKVALAAAVVGLAVAGASVLLWGGMIATIRRRR